LTIEHGVQFDNSVDPTEAANTRFAPPFLVRFNMDEILGQRTDST